MLGAKKLYRTLACSRQRLLLLSHVPLKLIDMELLSEKILLPFKYFWYLKQNLDREFECPSLRDLNIFVLESRSMEKQYPISIVCQKFKRCICSFLKGGNYQVKKGS